MMWTALLATEVFPTIVSATVTLAESSGDDDGNLFYLLLIGPAAGVGYYAAAMRRYRNKDKRHRYEHETMSEIHDVQSYDRKMHHKRGLRNSRIMGDNSRNPRERLGSGTTVISER